LSHAFAAGCLQHGAEQAGVAAASPAKSRHGVLRLAGPAAAWLTGQVLTVDGGLELA